MRRGDCAEVNMAAFQHIPTGCQRMLITVRSESKRTKKMTQALCNPVCDEKLCVWYRPDDEASNWVEFSRRYTALLGKGQTTDSDMMNAFNRVKVGALFAICLMGKACSHPMSQLLQEYFEGKPEGVQPFKTLEDIHHFFDWALQRADGIRYGRSMFIKNMQYIQALVDFQGYVQWNYELDDHLKQLKAEAKRQHDHVRITADPSTDRHRYALPAEKIEFLVETLAWKLPADQGILLHQFTASMTQTLMRPPHLLNIPRVNVKLTDPAEESLRGIFGSVPYSEIGSAGSLHKLKSEGEAYAYEIGTFKVSSADPHASHGARLVHDYARMKNRLSIDGCRGGLADLVGNAQTGVLSMPMSSVELIVWYLKPCYHCSADSCGTWERPFECRGRL